MEEMVYWLTQGSPGIDAFFVAKIVLVMMGLELLTCICGLLGKAKR